MTDLTSFTIVMFVKMNVTYCNLALVNFHLYFSDCTRHSENH